jgi:hypothetical protein
MLANEAGVALDVSGVTSIDGAGLEATVRLIDAIHTFGGKLTIGCQQPSKTGVEGPSVSFETGQHEPAVVVLGRLDIRA